MAFARVNGVHLHYRLAGPAGAPALVLVNPLGGDLRLWDDLLPILSQRFRVVSFDQRGHGLTATPPRSLQRRR
jgi:pimeloyl-ACP methyl ester carboxylesterase